MNSAQFLIAATSSGSGKTTLTLGLLKELSNRGYLIQPFKCGPDYIDTIHHSVASGQYSINLDSFMCSDQHIKHLYAKYGSQADVCVIEGAMGCFDGYDCMKGSSAALAKLLDIPVILIVNAKSIAYSVAPILYGFKQFDSSLNVIGVIFNYVSSLSHYESLKEACEVVGLVTLGYLPNNAEVTIPSRHLGLSLDKNFSQDAFMQKVAELVAKHVDIDQLLALTQKERPVVKNNIIKPAIQNNHNPLYRIAVARDEAFHFYYHENIEKLAGVGEIHYFSPLHDQYLPESDFAYFPGGYPELYLSQLSENKSMRMAVSDYIEGGGKALAECGGMMYLSTEIISQDGNIYPMVGSLQQIITMQNMRLKLGYRVLMQGDDIQFRGHEFHYSRIEEGASLPSIMKAFSAKGRPVDTAVFRYKNLIAGYTHLYWGEMDIIAVIDRLLADTAE